VDYGSRFQVNAKWDMSTASKLGNVTQLAGFSDPVYAEAYINVNQSVHSGYCSARVIVARGLL